MTATMSVPHVALNKGIALTLAVALCTVMCFSFVMLMNPEVAFCDPTDPTQSSGNTLDTTIQAVVSEATNRVYTLLRSIVIPIIILFFCIAGYQLLIVGGTKGTEAAKGIIIKCFFAVIMVVAAPLFGREIGTWFKDLGNGGMDQYNPLA